MPPPSMTDIDRRQCRRVVPLEVMSFGLSRTGTHSLRLALKQLGYEDTYHYFSLYLENQRDCEMWIDIFKFERKGTFGKGKWDKLLGHCMATTDSPSVFFWQELMEAYPGRKIILTVRDSPEQYYRSFMSTIYPYFAKYHISSWNPLRWIYMALLPKDALWRMDDLYCYHMKVSTFPEQGIERYIAHNERVRQAVPKERLLEFNVKDGWEPLCKFLDKPVPDTPFPRSNSTAEMIGMLQGDFNGQDAIVRGRLLRITAVIVAVGSVVFVVKGWL